MDASAGPLLLHDVAAASADVTAVSGRLRKIERLALLLGRARDREAPLAVAYLSGNLPQGRVGIGYATIRDVLPVPPAEAPTLTLLEVDAAIGGLDAVGGPGSIEARKRLLTDLVGRCTELEQDFLVRLLLGELRQGAQEGVVLEAVAQAAGVAPECVRRAVMLRGDAGAVGRALLEDGGEALAGYGLTLFRPVKPMLAQTASDPREALGRLGPAVVDTKFDGVRVQVHRRGDQVRVYTRRLNEETEALPEVVDAALALPVDSVVLDGEALGLRADGTPRPFQETMRRLGRVRDVEALRRAVPLTPFFFDCLYVDGETLIDRPLTERLGVLDRVVPDRWRAPRRVLEAPDEAEAFLREVRGLGHEGLMAKDPRSTYVAGRRGSAWLKIKPTFTADLVILAAEWGSGRRKGWLSNVHLGARGEAPDEWVMVGKTFKGMTDAMLRWQTERFLELEGGREGRVVHLRPEVVAEVAFDGLQASPRYAGGLALRFARLKGYREDKGAEEADPFSFLVELHRRWS